jgi:hypothetical protein
MWMIATVDDRYDLPSIVLFDSVYRAAEQHSRVGLGAVLVVAQH